MMNKDKDSEKCLDCAKPKRAWIGAIPVEGENGDYIGSVCGDCAVKRCSKVEKLQDRAAAASQRIIPVIKLIQQDLDRLILTVRGDD